MICMCEEFCIRKQGPVLSSPSSSSLKLNWQEEKKKRRRQDKVQKKLFGCQHRQRLKVVHEGPRQRKPPKIKKKYILIREMQKKNTSPGAKMQTNIGGPIKVECCPSKSPRKKIQGYRNEKNAQTIHKCNNSNKHIQKLATSAGQTNVEEGGNLHLGQEIQF